jgi:Tfp pilus assembly protein FimT
MTSLSIFSVSSISAGRQLTYSVYELAGLLKVARTAAIAQNTYVGVGFYTTRQGNEDVLMVATLISNGGQLADLQDPSHCQLLSRCVVLKNVRFDDNQGYLGLSGVDEANNVDVSQSQDTLQAAIGGGRLQDFSNVIVITPGGEVMVNSGLARCVGIGLRASPVSSSKVRLAAVQVAGLSGQVSVFLQ